MATVNGNGGSAKPNGNTTKPKVTEQLAAFTARTTYDDIPPHAIAKLKDLIIDHLGVGAGAAASSESTPAFVNAVIALQGGTRPSDTPASCTAYRHGKTWAPQYAAMLNGVFSHSFDFDDTLAIGVIHIGTSVIPAALAQAELLSASGQDLLLAIAVGYEVTARLGRALGTGAYPRGFHNTATAGVLGAACAVASLKKLSPNVVEHALGLAGSMASGSMQFLEDGSWNKRMHPGWAAHGAFAAVALAEAGVTGAREAVEGRFGFLHAYTEREATAGEVLAELVHGLGTEWLFVLTALKPFPACRFTHTAIELAGEARMEVLGFVDAEVKESQLPARIEVRIPPAMFLLVGTPNENKIHPVTIVDGQFSIYYQVAVAWVFGTGLGWDVYSEDKMTDPRVATLADRITVVADPEIPDCGVRLEVEMGNGSAYAGKWRRSLDFPLGEEENPWGSQGVRDKFRSLVGSVFGNKHTEDIVAAVDDLEDLDAKKMAQLLL